MITFSCRKDLDNIFDKENTNKEYVKNSSKQKTHFKITSKEAGIFALNFINTHFKNKLNVKIKNIKNFATPLPNKKLYLVTLKPKGFILLSDDIRDVPVLAFSEYNNLFSESFNELPVGAKEWITETILLNYELEKAPKVAAENNISKEWKLYLSDTITSTSKNIPPIEDWDCTEYYIGHMTEEFNNANLSTFWGQGSPYNLYTPICQRTGEHKPTGCVATAMAQIMNFWKYPSGFNWSVMRNAYSSNDVSYSAHEVAWLMYVTGIMAHMNYECDSSGTTSRRAKNALKNSFNFSSQIELGDYSYDDVKNELIWGRPVILGGYRSKYSCCGINFYYNGHSWITDGFRREYDKYIKVCELGPPYGTTTTTIYKNHRYWMHMNWGWKGYANGWYFSNELAHPHGIEENYKWNKDMIIKIHP